MPADVFHAVVTLPLDDARKIIAATMAEGEARKLQPLTVVVLDAGGNVVSMDRADGAGMMRTEVALGKARAALGIGIDSGTIGSGQITVDRQRPIALVIPLLRDWTGL